MNPGEVINERQIGRPRLLVRVIRPVKAGEAVHGDVGNAGRILADSAEDQRELETIWLRCQVSPYMVTLAVKGSMVRASLIMWE